jgi:iron complex transport system substrate-binding protein
MIAAKPDFVFAGRYTTRPAVAIARRIGLKVIDLAPATSLGTVRDQIREVAAALGQVERGEAMISALDARLAPPPPGDRRPVATVYRANGMTVGAGSLVDTAIGAAGFDNLARRLGLKTYMYLPLETLIANQPDILIVDNPRATYPSVAESILRHPALAAAIPPDRRARERLAADHR